MKKSLFVEEISKGVGNGLIQRIDSVFVIGEKRVLPKKQGGSYLHLVLVDRTGSVKAKIWDDANIPFDSVPDEGVVSISGRVEVYNNTVQIIVEAIEPVEIKNIDPSDFVPSSCRDPEDMLRELKKFLRPAYSSIFKSILEKFFRTSSLLDGFKKAPGAVKVHHAYLGGLLEHTLGVVRLCNIICDIYSFLDRPLMLTGALFHDVGKIREYRYDWKLDYTDEGRLIGHSVLGVQILDDLIRSLPSFPSEKEVILKHMILSHHGEIETGAVQLPMTREAMALHLADDLDARMASLNRIYEESGPDDRWTPYQSIYSRRFFLALSGSSELEDNPVVTKPMIKGQKTLGELLRKLEPLDDENQ